MASMGLQQINGNANRHGNFLDLVFTNMPNETSCELARNEFLIDSNTEHHYAIDINLSYKSPIRRKIREINLRNINMRKLSMQIREMNFRSANLTHNTIANSSATNARLTAVEFADCIYSIQSQCTKKSYISSSIQSKHPWQRETS